MKLTNKEIKLIMSAIADHYVPNIVEVIDDMSSEKEDKMIASKQMKESEILILKLSNELLKRKVKNE